MVSNVLGRMLSFRSHSQTMILVVLHAAQPLSSGYCSIVHPTMFARAVLRTRTKAK